MTLDAIATSVAATLAGGSIAGVFRWARVSIRARKHHDRLVDEALVSIEHHEIYQLCNRHLARGFISTDDLDDLGYLYRSYRALGGNGTGEKLYEKVAALPIKNMEGNL
jgi:hypothetical protein